MSSKFKLFGASAPPAADDPRHDQALRLMADDIAQSDDVADADVDLTVGLPPEFANLAAQLMGESNQLAAAYPADGARRATVVAASVDQSEPAEDSPADTGQRFSQLGSVRRWTSAAAAVVIGAGLWAVMGSPGNQRQPVQPPPTTARVIEPAAAQPPAVHAVIFSELSGAEQEGLLDLLSESGSIGSI